MLPTIFWLLFLKFRTWNTSPLDKCSKETNVQISGSSILCVDNFRKIARRSTARSFIRLRRRRSLRFCCFRCDFWCSFECVPEILESIEVRRRQALNIFRELNSEQLSCDRRSAAFVMFRTNRLPLVRAIVDVSAPWDLHDSRKIENNIIFTGDGPLITATETDLCI